MMHFTVSPCCAATIPIPRRTDQQRPRFSRSVTSTTEDSPRVLGLVVLVLGGVPLHDTLTQQTVEIGVELRRSAKEPPHPINVVIEISFENFLQGPGSHEETLKLPEGQWLCRLSGVRPSEGTAIVLVHHSVVNGRRLPPRIHTRLA